ncbi:hypothetical protein, partial [Actinocorallia lasiicapitis]
APSGTAPAPAGSDPADAGLPTSTPTPPSSSATKAMSDLAKCMKKYGVDIPADPSATWSPPPGYDADKAKKAFEKCLPAQATPPAS